MTQGMGDPRVAFFDSIAEMWDGWHDMAALSAQFSQAFDAFGLEPGEKVLDVGCGTGNLTQALLERLGPDGGITAIDLSPAMLARARCKVADHRVTWVMASAESVPLGDGACDRVLCFSAWPHFLRPEAVVREFHRVLRPGGHAHVFHFISRERVNLIHSQASHASVRGDLLAPVGELARSFESGGFTVTATVDTVERYELSVRKRG